MRAILSDVHGNLEALQAVLDDAARHRVETVYCLGDTVGYGPDPRGCLDLVAASCAVTLRGNHEQAVLVDAVNFRGPAWRAILWTRERLGEPAPDRAAADRRRDFLAGLPERHREDGLLFVHGSARLPVSEYVLADDVHDLGKMSDIFGLVGRYCFQGHTHVAGVFTEEPGGRYGFGAPASYRLGGAKALINVGSVGQPRDGDWRACYALLDGDVVHFRRVEYDVATTVGKIHRTEGLDDFLGERLKVGR
jgi:diadenosine tetraphosphatase ApaH/serine/threonine PP2A family protein phosphatase